jgi:hypothetical protein
MLLSVLLIETTYLYSRLASAIILQRRERANRGFERGGRHGRYRP